MSATFPQTTGKPDLCFYAVSNSRHFVGLVGLINSIRLAGHDEAIVVTDVGMSPRQRKLVESAASVVDPPGAIPGPLAKHFGPLARPADVMVVLDADVLVVRRLDRLVDFARSGQLVFFENNLSSRFFEEWSALGMGRPEKQPYVNSGHFLGASSRMIPLLRALEQLQIELPAGSSFFDGGSISKPYYFADQDLLNAYLMTSVDSSHVLRLDGGLSPVPPFSGVSRSEALRCIGQAGAEPYVLHHILGKPWLTSTRRNLYVEILFDVLWASNAPIRLDPGEVPLRLRPSRLRHLDQTRASMQATITSLVRGEMAVRRRLAGRATRLASRFGRGTGHTRSTS